MTIPKSVQKLLEAIECTEMAILTDKDCEEHINTAKHGDSSKKKMISFNERI